MAMSQAPAGRPSGSPRKPAPAELAAVPNAASVSAGSGTLDFLRRQASKLRSLFYTSPVRCTGAMLLVSAVVFGLVLLNISVAQTSFQLADLQRRASELQGEQRRLRYEVAKAESPERIVEMSTSLGLVVPSSQEYLEGPSILVAGEPAEIPAGDGEVSR